MKITTARLAYRSVCRSAEKIRNSDPAAVEVLSPGDVVRQGDVYLVRLDVEPEVVGLYGSRQLSPGTTRGSRHVAEGDCETFRVDQADASRVLGRLVPQTEEVIQFFGPMVRAAGPLTVTHPEHGHRTLPSGSYLVVYQRSFARDEVRRARD